VISTERGRALARGVGSALRVALLLVGSVQPCRAEMSCELSLEGKLVVDQACKGDVRLNGVQLPCNGENGWAVVDPSRIRLQGAACETWKNQAAAAVEATFPCSIVAPLL
jgi:hypothetical protein